MARPSKLSSLTIDALLKMRDDVAEALKRRVEEVSRQLRGLGEGGSDRVIRSASAGKRSKLRGRKVAAKYRHPTTGETWAGRGARPRWLTAELKGGKKADAFLIANKAPKGKKASKRNKA